MVKYVYDFVEGNRDLKDLLGGKGANLAEMTRMGLPVPPGFTITTEACREYLATGDVPLGFFAEVADHLRGLEMRMGRDLGDPEFPLLVSVRSGAKFSMPGMMETVLDIGLSDASVEGLAAHTGNGRFAWDSYRRLIQMFGRTVFGVPGEEFEAALDDVKQVKGVTSDTDLDEADLRHLVEVYKKVFHDHTGREFPQAPHEQLYLAIRAVFRSWNAERAVVYRRQERIPATLGTAVNVMAMVYGNLGTGSGTGVAFTRDPATGARGVYGDYLENAQGEDVVAGIRNTMPLQDLAALDRRSFTALMGTCVCGAEALDIDGDRFRVGDVVVNEGDLISIDGATGAVYVGAVPVRPSAVARYLDGTLATGDDPLLAAVDRLLRHADGRRRLHVHANADTGPDAEKARRMGAQGIGLCRTEHMFLGERRPLVERLILADTDVERQAALDALLLLQRVDFVEILTAMSGLPVTIRLIDPPLHEFLPSLEDLAVRVAQAEERGENPGPDAAMLAAVRRMHESNPMLGLRGVRLGLVVPGLFAMQVRAIAEAAVTVRADGGDPQPEIMVPLVGAVQELEVVRAEIEQVLSTVDGVGPVPIGTMIEVPRAALTAGDIAHAADFFSFGTNDLTQMGWGFSRDDVEAAFFSRYLELGIFGVSPFESIDRSGIGRLIRIAVDEGRESRPDLTIGVCGEHGGDPDSVHFFHAVGLDYVSCSPYRVPVARLEAGRAAITGDGDGSDSR